MTRCWVCNKEFGVDGVHVCASTPFKIKPAKPEDRTEMKITINKSLLEQAIEVLVNVEITDPDDDGVVWINLPGNVATGNAILRVGKLGLIAAQCAKLFDKQRVGAITALSAALGAEPAVEPVAKAMTAHRAAYFMERFKKEEKLLGPNEQAAVDFVIDMLTATHTAPPPPAQPAVEPVGYASIEGLRQLQSCNGTSVWCESSSMWGPKEQAPPAPPNLIAIYTSHPPPAEVPPPAPRPMSDREWAAQPANLREGCTKHVPGVGDL